MFGGYQGSSEDCIAPADPDQSCSRLASWYMTALAGVHILQSVRKAGDGCEGGRQAAGQSLSSIYREKARQILSEEQRLDKDTSLQPVVLQVILLHQWT